MPWRRSSDVSRSVRRSCDVVQIGRGKRIDFDADERPVRIEVTDLEHRHDTKVTYPSPIEAIHATTGHAASLRGAGPYAYTTHYRAATPQELRRVEAPERPTMRRHVRGTTHDETQTEFDPAGQALANRRIDAEGNVVCIERITLHASGVPLAVRNERMRPNATCANTDIDNGIRTDERGRWIEQRMWMLRPDGQRRPMAVLTRQIEYVP